MYSIFIPLVVQPFFIGMSNGVVPSIERPSWNEDEGVEATPPHNEDY